MADIAEQLRDLVRQEVAAAWAARVATLEAHGGGHLLFTEAAAICATWRSSLAWRLAAALRRRAA